MQNYRLNIGNFFCCFFLISICVQGVAQVLTLDKTISINVENKGAKYILDEIEKKHKIGFAYQNGIPPNVPVFKMNYDEISIREILDILFLSLPFKYEEFNGQIIILPSTENKVAEPIEEPTPPPKTAKPKKTFEQEQLQTEKPDSNPVSNPPSEKPELSDTVNQKKHANQNEASHRSEHEYLPKSLGISQYEIK